MLARTMQSVSRGTRAQELDVEGCLLLVAEELLATRAPEFLLRTCMLTHLSTEVYRGLLHSPYTQHGSKTSLMVEKSISISVSSAAQTVPNPDYEGVSVISLVL